jgi:hypothetical protein
MEGQTRLGVLPRIVRIRRQRACEEMKIGLGAGRTPQRGTAGPSSRINNLASRRQIENLG